MRPVKEKRVTAVLAEVRHQKRTQIRPVLLALIILCGRQVAATEGVRSAAGWTVVARMATGPMDRRRRGARTANFHAEKQEKDMQSTVARKHRAVDEASHFPTPARIVARRPVVWNRIRAWTEQQFTAEKREEVCGILFILLVFILFGWFYYALHQALQNY